MSEEEIKEKKDIKENWLIKALRTIWKWLKDNWFVLVVFVTVILLAFTIVKGCNQDSAYQNLFDQYHESIQDHQTQIEQIRSVQQSERETREEQYRHFLEEMQKIEQNYKVELGRIETTRRNSQSQIVEDARRDPGTLTRRIKDTFGVPIEERTSE